MVLVILIFYGYQGFIMLCFPRRRQQRMAYLGHYFLLADGPELGSGLLIPAFDQALYGVLQLNEVYLRNYNSDVAYVSSILDPSTDLITR